MPRTMTVSAGTEAAAALRAVLSERAVRDAGSGRYRLDLALAARALNPGNGLALDSLLYAGVGRSPRSRAADARDLVVELVAGLAELVPTTRTAVARGYLTEEIRAERGGGGDALRLARQQGIAAAVGRSSQVARLVDAALANREPIRLQTFSARVLGNSKALGERGDLYRRLCEVLIRYDPALQGFGLDADDAEARRSALEAYAIRRDMNAATVLCFGPLAYRKHGRRFTQVLEHAETAECASLTLHQLRDAEVEIASVRQITIIENAASFLDYVDGLRTPGSAEHELAVCSGGQANWAVVELLRGFGGADVPVRHTGDLDRSGVLILRSLAARTGLNITPLWMEVATHRRFAARGQPITTEELGRVQTLVAGDDPASVGHALLREIERSRIWVEQEAFFEECMGERARAAGRK